MNFKMRKLEKLTLKKEVVSNLNDNEMNVLKGGTWSFIYQNCVSIRICPKYNYHPTPKPIQTTPDGKASPCQNYTLMFSCQDWCQPTPGW